MSYKKWSTEEVANFLRTMGAEDQWSSYARIIIEEDINGSILSHYKLSHLVKRGFEEAHAQVVLAARDNLDSQITSKEFPPNYSTRRIACDLHQQDFGAVALEDGKLVCLQCITSPKRRRQSFMAVDDFFQSERATVEKLIDEIKQKSRTWQSTIETIRDIRQEFNQVAKQTEEEINRYFTLLEAAVKARREQVLNEVECIRSNKQALLDAHLKSLVVKSEAALEACKSATEAFKTKSPLEWIHEGQTMKTQLAEHVSAQVTEICPTSKMVFSFDLSLVQELESAGEVKVCGPEVNHAPKMEALRASLLDAQGVRTASVKVRGGEDGSYRCNYTVQGAKDDKSPLCLDLRLQGCRFLGSPFSISLCPEFLPDRCGSGLTRSKGNRTITKASESGWNAAALASECSVYKLRLTCKIGATNFGFAPRTIDTEGYNHGKCGFFLSCSGSFSHKEGVLRKDRLPAMKIGTVMVCRWDWEKREISFGLEGEAPVVCFSHIPDLRLFPAFDIHQQGAVLELV